VRRHPHVFGEEASRAAGNRADVDAAVEGSSAAVLRNWEEIKAAEALHAAGAPSASPESRLDSVQRAMPALAEAAKLGAKARKSGFDWPDWRDLLPKLAEETAELEAEAASATRRASRGRGGAGRPAVYRGQPGPAPGRGCGDGAARLQPALPAALSQMELASERPLEELAPDELEELWAAAKRESWPLPVRGAAMIDSLLLGL
jgi:hypothetical protein